MSGPTRTSTIPPNHHEGGPEKSDHVRKLTDFILAHIVCRNSRDLPGYSLELGNNSKFHVMRHYLSHKTKDGTDLYVSEPEDPNAIDDIKELVTQHDFFSQELIIGCDVNGETMHLHISKNTSFELPHSDVSLRNRTRGRVLRSLSDSNPDNSD
jgi:hypothetical protein